MAERHHQPSSATPPPKVSADLPKVHGIGLTVLHSPPAGSVVADVVLVHGLMGHPRDTWVYGKVPPKKAAEANGKGRTPESEDGDRKRKGLFSSMPFRNKTKQTGQCGAADRSTESAETAFSTTPSPRQESALPFGVEEPGKSPQPVAATGAYCYWPSDLLPHSIPDVRVLTYGYESWPTRGYAQSATQMTITQHAEDLLVSVTLNRSDCRGRPVIFIAHSLGGILVKAAMNESLQRSRQPQYLDFATSCRAIVFFGTPHHGADIAQWGQVFSNIVGALPAAPSTYDGVLRGLVPESETLYTISRRFNDQLDDPGNKIQICSIQEGQGMVAVKGLSNKIVPDTSSTFNRPSIEQSFVMQTANHRTMCRFSSADDPGYRKFIEILEGYRATILESTATFEHEEQRSNAVEHQAFLDQLHFGGRLERQRHLNRLVTTEQSFEWIWASSFVPWLQSSGQLFWIVGHPASGKSTLTNCLAESPKLRELLRPSSGPEPSIIRFFFDYRGADGIRNNFQGLKRSLLHQLLIDSPQISRSIEKEFSLKRTKGLDWLGDEATLTKVLKYTLELVTNPTFLFLDGLDEYGGEKVELLTLIEDVSAAGVRVCLTSRDESPFRVRLRHVPCLRMDQVNRPGIRAHALTSLTTSLRPVSPLEVTSVQELAEYITDKSAGVFLWARFAVNAIINLKGEEILAARHQGDGFDKSTIDDILEQFPTELGEIYFRIFESKQSPDKVTCGKILRLIASARRVLQLSELFEASLLVGVHLQFSSTKVQQSDLAAFERSIKALGGGVIELVSYRPQSDEHRKQFRFVEVRIIHRSLQTYLEEKGWVQLLGNDVAGQPLNLMWLEVCTAFLQKKKIRWSQSHDLDYEVTGLSESLRNYGWTRPPHLGWEGTQSLDILQMNLTEYVTL